MLLCTWAVKTLYVTDGIAWHSSGCHIGWGWELSWNIIRTGATQHQNTRRVSKVSINHWTERLCTESTMVGGGFNCHGNLLPTSGRYDGVLPWFASKELKRFLCFFFLALALDATEELRIHELGNFKIHICYYYGGLCNKRWAHYSKWTLHHHYYSFPYNESYYVKRCFSLVLFIYHATLWKVCFFFDCGEWKIPFQLGVAVLVVLSCVGWGPAQQRNSSTPQRGNSLNI